MSTLDFRRDVDAPRSRRVKPVVTLNSEDLSLALRDLWGRIGADPVAPDAIVGIETGGFVCAKILNQDVSLPLFRCALRRPSTATKSKPLVKRALANMPYGVTNWLRRFEDWSLQRKSTRSVVTDTAEVVRSNAVLSEHIAEIDRHVRAAGLRHLIVLDDAIDSGVTISVVVNALRNTLPEATRITSAVLTQTRPDSIFTPDVALFHSTLCRFPWSFDFRGTV